MKFGLVPALILLTIIVPSIIIGIISVQLLIFVFIGSAIFTISAILVIDRLLGGGVVWGRKRRRRYYY